MKANYYTDDVCHVDPLAVDESGLGQSFWHLSWLTNGQLNS